ncbi:hypothetical protein GCM10009655_23350 [Rhodoglobus aureus]|uniref:Uncharacterized protein n=1 Tax=Rhodoglobus aureus TaxID=191497 RepID=A0ABN1VUE5_9MICO
MTAPSAADAWEYRGIAAVQYLRKHNLLSFRDVQGATPVSRCVPPWRGYGNSGNSGKPVRAVTLPSADARKSGSVVAGAHMAKQNLLNFRDAAAESSQRQSSVSASTGRASAATNTR